MPPMTEGALSFLETVVTGISQNNKRRASEPLLGKRCSATLGTWQRFRRFVGVPSSTASVRRYAFEASR